MPRLQPDISPTSEPPALTDHSLKSLFSGTGGVLGELAQRARQIQTLTDAVKSALAGPEREHVLAAAWHDDTLVITTDSAAWTAQIRFAQDDLRKVLVAQGEKVFVQLKVRVGHGS